MPDFSISFLGYIRSENCLFQGKSNELPVHCSIWVSRHDLVGKTINVLDVFGWIVRVSDGFSKILIG